MNVNLLTSLEDINATVTQPLNQEFQSLDKDRRNFSSLFLNDVNAATGPFFKFAARYKRETYPGFVRFGYCFKAKTFP